MGIETELANQGAAQWAEASERPTFLRREDDVNARGIEGCKATFDSPGRKSARATSSRTKVVRNSSLRATHYLGAARS